MSYFLAYNPSLGNALAGISETTLPYFEYLVYEQLDGELPDLSRFMWNSSTLTLDAKFRISLSKREFLKKFTPDEYSTIKSATLLNTTVDYYWQLFTLADEVVMTDFDTISGIHLLELAGLIGTGRANEILN